VVVVGPTAAGKSALAVQLASVLGGEVVSADSMQVYRGFDIGTGKLALEERRGIPHHLLDVVDPDESFSAARFVEAADGALSGIAARGRVPVVAGGSGLYVRALLRGLFESPPADPRIREEHRRLADRDGVESLHARLAGVDPEAAARILARDLVRISRALEVLEQTGETLSSLQRKHLASSGGSRYPSLLVGIDPPRGSHRPLIEARIDAMLEAGWRQEVERLVEAGHGRSRPMGAIGYRHLRAHLEDALDLPEAVRQIKRDTWRFSRRQRTWFASEPDILWHPDGSRVDAEGVARALDHLRAVRPGD
jgi:tRNA dimethylallyltransferase